MNKENCNSIDWCEKYSEPDKDLCCEDCDHFIPSIDDIMMRFEI